MYFFLVFCYCDFYVVFLHPYRVPIPLIVLIKGLALNLSEIFVI